MTRRTADFRHYVNGDWYREFRLRVLQGIDAFFQAENSFSTLSTIPFRRDCLVWQTNVLKVRLHRESAQLIARKRGAKCRVSRLSE